MKILIVANGEIKNFGFYKDLIDKFDLVICADGGANFCHGLKIIPDYIIGDFDSVDKILLEELKNNYKTKVIYDPDQDKTDLELAIKLAESFNPDEINIIGAIGDRMDHTLANIICLDQVNRKIKTKIINEKNEIELIEDFCEIKGERGEIVSVIPLNLVTGLTYTGLKYGVKDKQVNLGWLGVCNRLSDEKASINLQSGKVLIIRSKNLK
ncbi:MAG TPA: thiamine diphosphokinase [Candidatus Magasanikbacteria bacterium]|nr:thiamine diphosphokinase [Candidatus Magasanikbacteria bacterium]